MTKTSSKPGNKALRKGRFSIPGQIYFITFNVKNRNPLFADWWTACYAARILSSRPIWGDAKLLSWVLMPDHFHGLVEVGNKQTLSTMIKTVKGRSAYLINQHRQLKGSVWSNDFYDRALRKEEDLLSVARYIVLNPVRAGLVKRCGDYPFWDAVWLQN